MITTARICPVSQQRVAMELSSIGDQVFAVESITKKRVRKVRLLLLPLTFAASCR